MIVKKKNYQGFPIVYSDCIHTLMFVQVSVASASVHVLSLLPRVPASVLLRLPWHHCLNTSVFPAGAALGSQEAALTPALHSCHTGVFVGYRAVSKLHVFQFIGLILAIYFLFTGQ